VVNLKVSFEINLSTVTLVRRGFFLKTVWTVSKVKVKVKVKVTLVQALRLCTGRTAHRGSRGVALPFHDHSTRRE